MGMVLASGFFYISSHHHARPKSANAIRWAAIWQKKVFMNVGDKIEYLPSTIDPEGPFNRWASGYIWEVWKDGKHVTICTGGYFGSWARAERHISYVRVAPNTA